MPSKSTSQGGERGQAQKKSCMLFELLDIGLVRRMIWGTMMYKGLPYPLHTVSGLGKRFVGKGSHPQRHGHSEQPPKLNQIQGVELIGWPVGPLGRQLSWMGPLSKSPKSLVWRSI